MPDNPAPAEMEQVGAHPDADAAAGSLDHRGLTWVLLVL
jgi:hypothetical protein